MSLSNSGSSSGSSSIPHSFSVEEIQKGRSLLKSSKSYPDDFLKKSKEAEVALEDGDNSSSGVSSDQEVPGNATSEFSERLSQEHNLNVSNNKNSRSQQSKFARALG